MNKYSWAANSLKLDRAIGLAGVGATEDAVKEIYEHQLGGKVIPEGDEVESEAPKAPRAPRVKKTA